MTSVANILTSLAECRVLVIDDTEAEAQLAAVILTRAGLTDIVTLTDPRRAEEALLLHDPDLVLLDLRMPQVSGFDVLEIIRRFTAGTYLPTLVLTVDDSPDSIRRAFDAGAADYVHKPFHPTELALRVRAQLQNRLAYLELRRSRAWLRTRLDLFEPDLAHLDLDAAEARRLIRATIAADGLRIAVQPIVDMRDGTRVGAEALSRFPDSPLGGPAGWFAAAMDLDLSDVLEFHALVKAVEILPTQPPGSRLAINLSPITLVRAADRLAAAAIPWHRVTLELTERIPIDDYTAINALLAPLREAGAHLSVDDTGAGFASLRHILELRPDVIKVDIGIIRGVVEDPIRQALVTMLVQFADSIGARLVAEGVETQEQRDLLLELGASYAQGRLFGFPELVDLRPDDMSGSA